MAKRDNIQEYRLTATQHELIGLLAVHKLSTSQLTERLQRDRRTIQRNIRILETRNLVAYDELPDRTKLWRLTL